jgi:D-arabinose 1-dehydrogenase-like Zn-dependent alcohol dehydrogenase
MGHERIDEAIAFAVEGKVRADIKTAPLSDINTILPTSRQVRSKGAWCWI